MVALGHQAPRWAGVPQSRRSLHVSRQCPHAPCRVHAALGGGDNCSDSNAPQPPHQQQSSGNNAACSTSSWAPGGHVAHPGVAALAAAAISLAVATAPWPAAAAAAPEAGATGTTALERRLGTPPAQQHTWLERSISNPAPSPGAPVGTPGQDAPVLTAPLDRWLQQLTNAAATISAGSSRWAVAVSDRMRTAGMPAAANGAGPLQQEPGRQLWAAAGQQRDVRWSTADGAAAPVAWQVGSSTGPQAQGPLSFSFGDAPQQQQQQQLQLGRSAGAERDLGGANEQLLLSSESEDAALEAYRQVESQLESALGVLGAVLQPSPDKSEADRSTEAAHALIREVWEVVDANYYDARVTGFERAAWAQLRDSLLAERFRGPDGGYRAVRQMIARGLRDPYCRFIEPAELSSMKKYDVSGVGLNLGTAAEYSIKTGNPLPAGAGAPSGDWGVFVVGVSKGSPADVAGVRQGDELLAVDTSPLASSTPFQAASLIAGTAQPPGATAAADGGSGGYGAEPPAGTVRLKVRSAASGAVSNVSVARPVRTLPSAVSTKVTRSVQPPAGPDQQPRTEVVGTIRLAAFNARAQSDVAAAVRQLEGAGATRLILDLRDNRGGLVTEGLEVVRLFMEGNAPIVITERRDGPADQPLAPGPALSRVPLLVLVNGHTASASEIVAGALHDSCRALLAGSRTYGKGLIQSVYELSDGSGLIITVGKYLTPNGTDIDRFGINPDFSSIPSFSQYDSALNACKLNLKAGAVGQQPAPPLN